MRDDARADSLAAERLLHDEGADLRHRRAQSRQLGASHNLTLEFGDEEAGNMLMNVVNGPRQQMTGLQIRRDQIVDS